MVLLRHSLLISTHIDYTMFTTAMNRQQALSNTIHIVHNFRLHTCSSFYTATTISSKYCCDSQNSLSELDVPNWLSELALTATAGSSKEASHTVLCTYELRFSSTSSTATLLARITAAATTAATAASADAVVQRAQPVAALC
jgi:hypothetical protein